MGGVDGGTEVTEGGWGTVGGWALLPGPSPRIGVSLPAGGIRVSRGVLWGEPQEQSPHDLLPHVHALHQSLQGRGLGVPWFWGLGGDLVFRGESDPTLG